MNLGKLFESRGQNPSFQQLCQLHAGSASTTHFLVDDLTRAKCVHDYLERSEAPMRVCAACGVRDPFDTCAKSVALLALPDTQLIHESLAYAKELERIV